MIEKTDFGDPFGGSGSLECNCAGLCDNHTPCNCSGVSGTNMLMNFKYPFMKNNKTTQLSVPY